MKQMKSSSESHRVRREIQALRAEEPRPEAIDRTVDRVLAYAPEPVRTRPTRVWRLAPLAAALGVGATLFVVSAQSAKAAGWRAIAEAVRHQTKRHALTYRPDARGNLVLMVEDWVDGLHQAQTFYEPNGERKTIGYDGERMFVYSGGRGGYVDDVEPSNIPLEDLDSYLQISSAHVDGMTKVGGLDLYRVSYSNVRFDLYIAPQTRLPVRRDVLDLKGRLIERNVYDYPKQMAPALFRAPEAAGLTDYSEMRRRLAEQARQPGLAKGDVSLRAVIVGPSRIIALWTGSPSPSGSGIWIEGMPKPAVSGSLKSTVHFGGETLAGNGAWYTDLKGLRAPFTVNVPVMGKGGKVDRLTFRVTHPIWVADPDRLIRTSIASGVAGAQTAKP